jgi:hypothetical protein
MTEPEWLACSNPESMLRFLKDKAEDRPFRLFAVACCRRLWQLVTEDVYRNAVDVAERYANGLASEGELRSAYDTAAGAAGDDDANIAFAITAALPAFADVSEVAERTARAIASEAFAVVPPSADDMTAANAAYDAAWTAERAAQARLLRDVFGNPFR